MGDEKRPLRGRRDARWMWTPLFIALASGAFGFLLVWVSVLYMFNHTGEMARTPIYNAFFSIAWGLVFSLMGLASALPTGVVLTFVVGRDRGPAGRRTALIAAPSVQVVSAGVVLVVLGLAGGFLGLLWMVVTATAAALIAGWWHDRLLTRSRQGGSQPTRLSTWPS